MIQFFSILCAIWILALLLITWGLGSLRYLRTVPPAANSGSKVSIVVAARDEAATIERALYSLLTQDYGNYEVLVVNDRSGDATGKILERMRQEHPQLQVVHVDALPASWLGKNHAMHLAATRASGDYILFTDADVVMEPSALSRAVSHCERNHLDHIAVFPAIPAPNYWTNQIYDRDEHALHHVRGALGGSVLGRANRRDSRRDHHRTDAYPRLNALSRR